MNFYSGELDQSLAHGRNFPPLGSEFNFDRRSSEGSFTSDNGSLNEHQSHSSPSGGTYSQISNSSLEVGAEWSNYKGTTSQLERQNQELKLEVLSLRSELRGFKGAYSQIISALNLPAILPPPTSSALQVPVPLSAAATSPLLLSSAIDAPPSTNPYLQTTIVHVPELNRDEYPAVTWWFRENWKDRKQRGMSQMDPAPEDLTNNLDNSMDADPADSKPECGRSRSSQGVNDILTYVQLENGETVTGFRANEIRGFARGLWALMAEGRPMSSSWDGIDAARRSRYHYDMRTKFPELGYCHNNWKADYIATIAYPSWYTLREKKVKLEDEADAILLDNAGSKRHLDPPNHKAKRIKTSPTPSHLTSVVGNAGEPRANSAGDYIKVDDIGAEREKSIHQPSEPLRPTTQKKKKTRNQDPLSQVVIPPPANDFSIPDLVVATNITPEAMPPSLNNLPIIGAPAAAATPDKMPESPVNPFIVAAQTLAGSPVALGPSTDTSEGQVPSTITIMDIGRPTNMLHPELLPNSMPDTSDLNGQPHSDPPQELSPRPVSVLIPAPLTPTLVPTLTPTLVPALTPMPMPVPSTEAREQTAVVGALSSDKESNPVDDDADPDTSQTITGPKRSAKMKPTGSKTARNLCAIQWCEAHPNGTTAEFKKYFEDLPKHEKKVFEEASKKARQNK